MCYPNYSGQAMLARQMQDMIISQAQGLQNLGMYGIRLGFPSDKFTALEVYKIYPSKIIGDYLEKIK